MEHVMSEPRLMHFTCFLLLLCVHRETCQWKCLYECGLFKVTQERAKWAEKQDVQIVSVTKWLNWADWKLQILFDLRQNGTRSTYTLCHFWGFLFVLKRRKSSLLLSYCRMTDKSCLKSDWHPLPLFIWPNMRMLHPQIDTILTSLADFLLVWDLTGNSPVL